MPRTRLFALLSAAWFITVLAVYHFGGEPHPPGGLASLLLDIVLLTGIGAAAWGLGSFLMAPLRLEEDSPGEAPLFEIGAGLGALALIVFALAAAQILYRALVIVVLAVCVMLLARRRGQGRSSGTPRPWSRAELAMIGVPVAAGIMTLAASLAPPEFYDALLYHLAVPDQYVRHHGMIPIRGNYQAHYPANMGMLFAVGLLLRGGPLAQSIHWLCGALAVASIFAAGCRHIDRPTGLLACVLFALTPGVLLTSTWAIADLGVTMFASLCFAAVLHLWRGGDRRWLIAAALCAGLALGVKYTAAAVVCAPAALAIALRPGPRGRALREAALFAVIALALVSPWLARNALFTGNPLAPYFSAASPGLAESHPDIAGELARRLPADGGAPALLGHYLLAPWRATMSRIGHGGYLGPLFLMLIPVLLVRRGHPSCAAPLALMAGIGGAAWAVTSQVIRYLFPVLAPAALLAAMAARRLPKVIVVPVIAWSLAWNVYLFSSLIETQGTFRVLTRIESVDDYLGRRVPYHPAMVWLESRTPPETKVLFVGEGRTFYCARTCVAASPFDAPLLDRYAAEAGSEAGLMGRLRAEGFTHLLVSDPELRRTRATSADDVMRRFFPSGSPRLEFERNGVRVYSLPG